MILIILIFLTIVFLAAAIVFTKGSIKEQEWRAVKIGYGGIVLMVLLGVALILLTDIRWLIGAFYAVFIFFPFFALFQGSRTHKL